MKHKIDNLLQNIDILYKDVNTPHTLSDEILDTLTHQHFKLEKELHTIWRYLAQRGENEFALYKLENYLKDIRTELNSLLVEQKSLQYEEVEESNDSVIDFDEESMYYHCAHGDDDN